MAIGIDASRAFSERATGIGVYATEICRGLAADPPAELVFYLNQPHPPEGLAPLPAPSHWRCIPFPRGWTAIRLRWELRRHRPQLLFIPAYRLPGGPIPRSVVTIHGVEHRFARGSYPAQEAERVERFVQDTLRRAARVISPSETTKADLVNLYQADPRQIVVIPHGVARGLAPVPGEQGERLRAEIGVEGPYLLAVGAHHPRKNIGFLLEAYAGAFPASEPPGSGPRLVVTNATGEAQQKLAASARDLGVSDRVLLLPHISGRQLAAVYSGALAACVPSLYEGFGLPALEAMACGAPVLANGVGGVQEVAEGAALLLDPGDRAGWVEALQRLSSDPELRRHLTRLGMARAQRFSWELSVAAHSALLRSELSLG